MPWTRVNQVQVNHLLRKFKCADAQGAVLPDFTGVGMLTGTIVQAFHNQLLTYGLPFRVDVRGVAKVHKTTTPDDVRDYGFVLPPFSINPALVHGLNSWQAFLQLLTHQLTYLAQDLHGTESGIVWVGIEKLDLNYVPQNNLAAFLHHIQGVGGGAKHELPEDLKNKHPQ